MAVAQVGDCRLHYIDRGQGPVLVLLHGLGGSGFDWEHQVPFFASRYRVIVPDLRGFGASTRGWRLLTVRRCARDVRELLDQLGITRYALVGHSMGGAIAQQLALEDSAGVERLIITNSLPSFRPRRLRHVREIAYRWLVMAVFGPARLSRRTATRLYPLPEQAALRERSERRGARNSRLSYLMALSSLSCWSVLSRLPRLAIPVLVLEAEFDYFAHADIAHFAQVLPQVEMVSVPDAHHALPSEQPEAFNARVDAFLRARAAPGDATHGAATA